MARTVPEQCVTRGQIVTCIERMSVLPRRAHAREAAKEVLECLGHIIELRLEAIAHLGPSGGNGVHAQLALHHACFGPNPQAAVAIALGASPQLSFIDMGRPEHFLHDMTPIAKVPRPRVVRRSRRRFVLLGSLLVLSAPVVANASSDDAPTSSSSGFHCFGTPLGTGGARRPPSPPPPDDASAWSEPAPAAQSQSAACVGAFASYAARRAGMEAERLAQYRCISFVDQPAPVHVFVTYQSAGHASAAHFEPPLVGQTFADCMRDAYLATRVPCFHGDPVIVTLELGSIQDDP